MTENVAPEATPKAKMSRRKLAAIIGGGIAGVLVLTGAFSVPALNKQRQEAQIVSLTEELNTVNEATVDALNNNEIQRIEVALDLDALKTFGEKVSELSEIKDPVLAKEQTAKLSEAVKPIEALTLDEALLPTKSGFEFAKKVIADEAKADKEKDKGKDNKVVQPVISIAHVEAPHEAPAGGEAVVGTNAETISTLEKELETAKTKLAETSELTDEIEAAKDQLTDIKTVATAVTLDVAAGVPDQAKKFLETVKKAGKAETSAVTKAAETVAGVPEEATGDEVVAEIKKYVDATSAAVKSHEKATKEAEAKKKAEEAAKAKEEAQSTGQAEYYDPVTESWENSYQEPSYGGGGEWVPPASNGGGGWTPPPVNNGGGGGGSLPPATGGGNGGGGSVAPPPVVEPPAPYVCPPQPPGYYATGSTHTINGVTCPNYLPWGSGDADEWEDW